MSDHSVGVLEDAVRFFRALAVSVEHGQSLPFTVRSLEAVEYGSLRDGIAAFQGVIDLGLPLRSAWQEMAGRMSEPVLEQACVLMSNMTEVEGVGELSKKMAEAIAGRRDLIVQRGLEIAPINMQIRVALIIPIIFISAVFLIDASGLIRSVESPLGARVLALSIGLYALGYAVFRLLVRSALNSKSVRSNERLHRGLLVLRLFVGAGYDLQYVFDRLSRLERMPFSEVAVNIRKRREVGEHFIHALSSELMGLGDASWVQCVREIISHYSSGYSLSELLKAHEAEYAARVRNSGREQLLRLPFRIMPWLMVFYVPATMGIILLPLIGKIPWEMFS